MQRRLISMTLLLFGTFGVTTAHAAVLKAEEQRIATSIQNGRRQRRLKMLQLIPTLAGKLDLKPDPIWMPGCFKPSKGR
jgi:hypothetical protein